MAVVARMTEASERTTKEWLIIGLGWIGGVAILAYFVSIFLNIHQLRPTPYFAGGMGLLFLWAAYGAATGRVGIWNAVRGDDGRASTSKFQVTLWTAVVVFAWIALAVKGFDPDNLPSLPQNILLALGISVGTATAAAAVTSTNTASGKEVKVPAKDRGMAPLFQSDAGLPDIGKIQLLAWTLLAVAVYLGALSRYLGTDPLPRQLPDIDPSLMALTGLGSATYLGKKLVTTTTTYISTISTNRAFVGEKITLTGSHFGPTQEGGRVMIDGNPIETKAETWSDGMIVVAIPETHPDGSPWVLDKPVDVMVYGTGGPSANTVKLTLQAARIERIEPGTAAVGQTITLNGRGLGDATNVFFTGNAGAVPRELTDTSLKVDVPAGALSGTVTVMTRRGAAASEAVLTVS
jgi:hypothetical protein